MQVRNSDLELTGKFGPFQIKIPGEINASQGNDGGNGLHNPFCVLCSRAHLYVGQYGPQKIRKQFNMPEGMGQFNETTDKRQNGQDYQRYGDRFSSGMAYMRLGFSEKSNEDHPERVDGSDKSPH